MENFKWFPEMNIIKNYHKTVEDMNITENIFRPDVSSLKGKSMQGKPKPMRKDLIKIPKELMMIHHNNIELCMDTVYLNECSMLTVSLGPSSTKVWFHLKVDITKNTFVCSTKSSSTTRTLDL